MFLSRVLPLTGLVLTQTLLSFFAASLYLCPLRLLLGHHSQARLFPVLTRQQDHQQDESQTARVTAAATGAGVVLWMQDVQEHAATASSSSSPPSSSAPAGLPRPPPLSGEGGGGGGDDAKTKPSNNEAAAEWLAAERLSFKEILARADPRAEFRWRRQLEEGMGEEVGGGR